MMLNECKCLHTSTTDKAKEEELKYLHHDFEKPRKVLYKRMKFIRMKHS